jgi:hypothetical protein
MTFFVWSGTLQGVEVEAPTAREAFIRCVVDQEHCLVHGAVRVSVIPRGPDPTDVIFTFKDEDDFQAQFPELADHPDLEWQAAYVTGR